MKSSRLAILTVVVVVMVALVSSWDGSSPSARPATLDEVVPALGTPDSPSSTWFCAAGGQGMEPPMNHTVYLTNPSSSAVAVRMTAFDAEGRIGAQQIEVGPTSVSAFDVDKKFAKAGLSVMAESASGTLAVEHRLTGADMADSVPCATTSSDAWYFPAQSTALGDSARLVLFNPFSADAGVNVSAAIEGGTRAPKQWAGIVVPAGSVKVIDLSDHIERREQFSVTVEMRTGRLIAETTQTLSTPDNENSAASTHGLRLQLGVPEPRSVWVMAGGFKDPTSIERIVVQNPSRKAASVMVQVTPYGAASMLPEPFEVQIPAKRFSVLDLTGEGRVTDAGFHSIRVESEDKAPVVVARTIVVTGAPAPPGGSEGDTRPNETQGTTVSTGSPRPAAKWTIPAVPTGEDEQPMALIANPGTGIVKVTIQAVGADGALVEVATDAEVAPGDGLQIPLAPDDLAVAAVRFYEVTATSPVFVERLITFKSLDDLSLGLAVPSFK